MGYSVHAEDPRSSPCIQFLVYQAGGSVKNPGELLPAQVYSAQLIRLNTEQLHMFLLRDCLQSTEDYFLLP